MDVWRQPRTSARATGAAPARLRPGVYVRGLFERAAFPLWYGGDASVLVDVGVKTAGFIPGAPLDSGVVLRAGVALPIGPGHD
jgi:hypothetical protein